MILLPKIDSHTIASVDFTDGHLTDHAGKLTWYTLGGTPELNKHIIKDNKFGYAFSGLNSVFFSANVGKYLPNNHDVTMECWFYMTGNPNTDGAPFVGSGLMQLCEAKDYAPESIQGLPFRRAGLQFVLYGNVSELRWDRCSWDFCNEHYTGNTWHHAAWVKHGSYHYAFLDGQLVASGDSSYRTSTYRNHYGDWFQIGHGWGQVKMDGRTKLAHVRLSDIPRYTSAFDVYQVYQVTEDSKVPPYTKFVGERKDTHDKIGINEWNNLMGAVTDLAASKSITLHYTVPTASNCIKDGRKWVKKKDTIQSSQIKNVLGAINQLEASFNNNCCQANCCQSSKCQSCQSQCSNCTQCRNCHSSCNCHRPKNCNCNCNCHHDCNCNCAPPPPKNCNCDCKRNCNCNCGNRCGCGRP